jgi:hypothetical protein
MAARIGPWLSDVLERHRLLVLFLFSAVLFATTAIRARAKPFWHDEIYTVLHSTLPSVSAMWAAALDGLDLAAPLNSLLTRFVQSVAGVGPITTRLPPMIGFWAMTLVVFHMVRRRSNATLALAATLLPCYTAAYRYSYEARGYGLMLGLFALSLNSWAEAAQGRRRALHIPLLALTLAAGVWSHYYAVLGLIPIAIGEAVRLGRDKKPDWAIWGAIALSCLGALPLRPLMAVAAGQARTYWARTDIIDLGTTYRFLIEPLLELAPRLILGAAISAGFVLAGILARKRSSGPRHRLPAHEIAAGLACLLIPAIGVLVARLITGAFVPRYALSAVVGFSVTLPLAVWWAIPRSGLPEVVLCLVLAGSFTESALDSARDARRVFHDPVRSRPQLVRQLVAPGPVVVTGGLMFLQLWYYTPPGLRGRLWYLADPAAAFHYRGSDTFDRGFLVLRRWTPVTVQDYESFVAANREFRVYAAGSGWLLDKLRETGARIDQIGSELRAPIYRVTLP